MAINPLDYFNVGAQIGSVNSPAYGINHAITNILKQAESMGLVRAQADAQSQGAIDLAARKQELQPATKVAQVLDASGNLTPHQIGYNDEVVKPPSPNQFNFINGFKDDEGADPNKDGVQAEKEAQIRAQLIKFLQENGT